MVNDKKISFITAVNDEDQYKLCLYYLNNLIIPEGFDVDFIAIRNATSMCSACNKGCMASNAKYKVYLHQDVLIINKNFLNDILKIFKTNDLISTIGVCGPKKLPTNAVWWESSVKFGKVLEKRTNNLSLLKFDEIIGDYEYVSCIDGLIMITQYDLNWREDLFDGWHFYDISQCLEFKKQGYKTVVPNQATPWCIHDCGMIINMDGYSKYKEILIKNYSEFI